MGVPSQVAFLDLSHYVFHRFHSIITWCKAHHIVIQDDSEFLDRFDRLFITNLLKILRKLNLTWKHFYIVKDCLKDKVWRMEIFPLYKKNRTDKEKNPLISKVFRYVYEILLPRLEDVFQATIIGHDTAEADDVIAVLTKAIHRRNPHTKVIIVSSDSDYVQLVDENTMVVNSQCVDITTKLEPEVVLHYVNWKVIRGDPSDNIPAIDVRVGSKYALKMALDNALLKEKLKSCPNIRKRYELNEKLIDFNFIPKELQKSIEKLL